MAAWQSRQVDEVLDVPQPLRRSQPIQINMMGPTTEVDYGYFDMSPHPSGPNYMEANLSCPTASCSPPKVTRGTMDPKHYQQLMAGCKSTEERAKRARRLEAMRRA
eukprot:EG_transcript_63747